MVRRGIFLLQLTLQISRDVLQQAFFLVKQMKIGYTILKDEQSRFFRKYFLNLCA